MTELEEQLQTLRAEAEAAIAAAKSAFKGWRRTPPLERAKALRRIAQIIRDNAEELLAVERDVVVSLEPWAALHERCHHRYRVADGTCVV